MTSLARITETRAANELRRTRHNITAHERARIIVLLRTVPLPQVRDATGRALGTLMRIAEVAAKAGEL